MPIKKIDAMHTAIVTNITMTTLLRVSLQNRDRTYHPKLIVTTDTSDVGRITRCIYSLKDSFIDCLKKNNLII